MGALHEPARRGRTAPLSIVLLPPAHSGPQDFIDAGFAQAVRARGLNLDLTLAPLTFGHITDRSAVGRVLDEHIAPARARGSAVWLGGISLGAFVALCCAQRDPGALAGLCLLAPYLGSHLITAKIRRAGLAAWSAGTTPEDDDEQRVWHFLKTRTAQAPHIHLGLGREDRFGDRHQLLAAALAPGEVDTVAGGHDWPTWRRLWDNFLDARLTPRP